MRGCFWFLLVILVIGGLLAALFFRVPERMGLVSSRAEQLLAGTPDRAAGSTMLQEAKSAGFPATGVHLYVLPMKDGNSSIAFAILNATEGFAFPRGQGDPIIRTLILLGTTPTVQQRNVAVVGFEFIDDKGRSYMTVAARSGDIAKVARGQITPEEFIRLSYGNVRLDEIFTRDVESLQEFLSGS